MTITGLLTWIVILILGFVAGWILNSLLGTKNLRASQKEAKRLFEEAKADAKSEKKEKLIEAEDEIYQKKQHQEEVFRKTREALKEEEDELLTRENNLERKADLISKKEQDIVLHQRDIKNRENQLRIKQQRLEQLLDEENKRLERMAGISRDEAKQILMDNLLDTAKNQVADQVHKIMQDARKDAQSKAKDVIISAMEQTATDHAVESTVSIVALPSDDMKGRIIGREGRNIRAFEIVTGVDVIVDDTPNAVILSGYDPFRRELARLTMEKLVADGRIHPGRIEETYDKTVKNMNEYLTELGEQSLLETGVHGIHPDVVIILGKLRFRSSFGQNVLHHSKEVATIAGIMAAELGLDENMAKRAGILHDIGRGLERHSEGSHCHIGYEYIKRYGEPPVVLNAILGHHGEVEAISPITILVNIANEISRSRPGARRDVIENFVKRMENMEECAQSFEGVKASYAIQAGKEVRVIIDHEKIDDAQSHQLATDIANKIENEIDYPGQVKVVAIREFRAIDFA